MPMGSTGLIGKGFITHWKEQQWWFEENRIVIININIYYIMKQNVFTILWIFM